MPLQRACGCCESRWHREKRISIRPDREYISVRDVFMQWKHSLVPCCIKKMQYFFGGGVKFSDVNMDGKKDVLLLLQYCNDGDSWNMPVIFLAGKSGQYDVSGLSKSESYKVEAKTKNGTPFIGILFEEFLGKQHLTEKLSDMEGVWTDYCRVFGQHIRCYYGHPKAD